MKLISTIRYVSFQILVERVNSDDASETIEFLQAGNIDKGIIAIGNNNMGYWLSKALPTGKYRVVLICPKGSAYSSNIKQYIFCNVLLKEGKNTTIFFNPFTLTHSFANLNEKIIFSSPVTSNDFNSKFGGGTDETRIYGISYDEGATEPFVKRCKVCGMKNRHDSSYCKNCGILLR